MATQQSIKDSIGKSQLVQGDRLETLLSRVDVKRRFEEILGKKAPAFISSIISATKANPQLKVCDPHSILSSAVVAATLDLPINPSLGFAHMVPYSGKAQFQLGWKGFVQLAIRTGQYKTMNAAEVYEGELKSWNRVTGEIDIDLNGKKSDTVIGYVAFFKLINGFEKYHYMTMAEVTAHAKRYSKSFGSQAGQWHLNFNVMALKTVIKLLLSKYGILSVDMQKALQADQAIVVETPAQEIEFEHPDNPEKEAEISEAPKELINDANEDRPLYPNK